MREGGRKAQREVGRGRMREKCDRNWERWRGETNRWAGQTDKER